MMTATSTTIRDRATRIVWLLLVMGVGCTNALKNVDFGENARTFEPVSAKAAIVDVTYSDDGRNIAAVHTFVYPHDRRVSCVGTPSSWLRLWKVYDGWNSDDGLDLGSVSLGSRSLGPLRFTLDGGEIITWAERQEEQLVIWNTKNNKLDRRNVGWVLGVSPHGEAIVTRDEDTGLSVCDKHGLPIEHSWPSNDVKMGHAVWQNPFSADGRLLAIHVGNDSAKHQIAICDWRTGKQQASFAVAATVWSFAFSPDGRLVALTGLGGPIIKVHDTQTGELRQQLEMDADDFWDVAFSPDGQQLAVCGDTRFEKKKESQGQTVVWHVPTWRKLKTYIDRESWATTAVTFSPDSKTLACGTTKGIIRFHASPSAE